MSSTTDALVAFIRERLDEDEQVARAAAGTPWESSASGMVHVNAAAIAGNRHAWGTLGYVAQTDSEEYREHIARHDPARVIREVDAKRRLLDEYERLLRTQTAHEVAAAELAADIDHEEQTGHWAGAGSPDVRQRALRREADYLAAMRPILEKLVKAEAAVYADHEDFKEEWRP